MLLFGMLLSKIISISLPLILTITKTTILLTISSFVLETGSCSSRTIISNNA